MKKQIGKNTVGGGGKMTVHLKEYERSTHDLSYIWRSTMAPGTIVPFMKNVGLRGDTWDINLETSVLTHPTIGPLFGSFKVQLDIFTADIRLYQGQLHNNKLGIGLAMNNVKLPLIFTGAEPVIPTEPIQNSQINPSCILKYLGISGLGYKTTAGVFTRNFNAIPYLAYWDIVKNYYANKQETNAWMIHNTDVVKSIIEMLIETPPELETEVTEVSQLEYPLNANTVLNLQWIVGQQPNWDDVMLTMMHNSGSPTVNIPLSELFSEIVDNTGTGTTFMRYFNQKYARYLAMNYTYANPDENKKPQLLSFPLANIDTMRENILAATKVSTPFLIDSASIAPYAQALKVEGSIRSRTTPLEGLALKTYQSDLFNNWMKTEWISGANSVNDITKIDTTGGSITIDTITLKRKVYNMLNAIAVSGGSYYDWLDVNYEEGYRGKTETPVYHGGLSKEVIFQEVISNSSSADTEQPLGTLAGRGTLSKKHKGGYVRIKVDEHCYVMGMISLTPRIDYSQGNDWDVNLLTMDDFHKPALDGIGFQDLITDQMAWWDTGTNGTAPLFRSAGKQPSWINYMTAVNKCFGNFAIEDNQMFMTLNRRYELDKGTGRIKDLTTYIDPAKYNHIFAYTKRDAQNFWVQIGVNVEVRRKMSAKIMPQG